MPKKPQEPKMDVNPVIEATLLQTKAMLDGEGPPPMPSDSYCWKHGNIGPATMLMIIGSKLLSTHCLFCVSELLTATVGVVVPAEDFMKTKMLISSIAAQTIAEEQAVVKEAPSAKKKKE